MLTQKSNRMRTMWSHAAEGPAPYQGTIRPEASTFTSWYWIQFGGVSSFLACARAFDAANRVNLKSTAAATNAPGGAKRLDDGMCALLLAVFPPVPRIEIPGKREGFSRHATNSILPSPSGATSGLRRGRRSRSSSWWRAPPLCTKSDGEPQRGELARERLERQRGLRVNSGFADTVGMGLRPAKVDEKLSGRRLADEILWGRLVTCGRLAIGPCRLRGGPAAVTNRRAGCQPAPHWFFDPVEWSTGEQARAVERVADRHHHPAHGIFGDVEAVAEVVSRPQMVEDVPALCIERGVWLGHGSPGCGDALLQHARHPVSSPPHGAEAVHFGVGIERGVDAQRGEGGKLGAHGAGHKAVGIESLSIPSPDPQGVESGTGRSLPLVPRGAVAGESVVPDRDAGGIGHGQALNGEAPAVGAQRGLFQVQRLAAFVLHGGDLDAVPVSRQARLAHRKPQSAKLVHGFFIVLHGYGDARGHHAVHGFFEHDFVAGIPLLVGNERIEEAHMALLRGTPQREGDAVAGILNPALRHAKRQIALGHGRKHPGGGRGGALRIDGHPLVSGVIEILRRRRKLGSAEGACLDVQHGLEAGFPAQFRSGFDLLVDLVLPFVRMAGSLGIEVRNAAVQGE